MTYLHMEEEYIKAAEIFAQEIYGHDNGHTLGIAINLAYANKAKTDIFGDNIPASAGIGNEYMLDLAYKAITQTIRPTVTNGDIILTAPNAVIPTTLNRDINNIITTSGTEINPIHAYDAQFLDGKSFPERILKHISNALKTNPENIPGTTNLCDDSNNFNFPQTFADSVKIATNNIFNQWKNLVDGDKKVELDKFLEGNKKHLDEEEYEELENLVLELKEIQEENKQYSDELAERDCEYFEHFNDKLEVIDYLKGINNEAYIYAEMKDNTNKASAYENKASAYERAMAYNAAKAAGKVLAVTAEYPYIAEYGLSAAMIAIKGLIAGIPGAVTAIQSEVAGHLTGNLISQAFADEIEAGITATSNKLQSRYDLGKDDADNLAVASIFLTTAAISGGKFAYDGVKKLLKLKFKDVKDVNKEFDELSKAKPVTKIHPDIINIEPHILKPEINLPSDLNNPKLRKKFDNHKSAFGMNELNLNKQNLELFKQKIIEHINHPETTPIAGKYSRGVGDVVHYYNPKTEINVINDMNGDFVSVWIIKEGTEQYNYLITTGKIGGDKKK